MNAIKSACYLSTLVVALAAPPSWQHLAADYSFDAYKIDFGKSYNATEELFRSEIFQAAHDEAIAHNADSQQTWKMAINQFSDRTQNEFRNSHGWLNPKSELLSTQFEPQTIPVDFNLADLPKSVDWREKGVVTKVKNQGMCGSCWAFASTENIESAVALNTSKLVELSPQNLVSCDPNPKHCGGTGGCLGSIPELAFDFVNANGLASEAEYPYKSGGTSTNGDCMHVKPTAGITGHIKLPANNYSAVMYTLAHVGPVAVNVDAIPMQSYGGGLFTGCAVDKTHIDHVVQIVGYGYDSDLDKPYWLLRNSWGTTWGEQGYMKLLRHNPSEAWCSLDIYPLDGTGCTGGPGTVKVCGSCGILWDVSYPTGGFLY